MRLCAPKLHRFAKRRESFDHLSSSSSAAAGAKGSSSQEKHRGGEGKREREPESNCNCNLRVLFFYSILITKKDLANSWPAWNLCRSMHPENRRNARQLASSRARNIQARHASEEHNKAKGAEWRGEGWGKEPAGREPIFERARDYLTQLSRLARCWCTEKTRPAACCSGDKRKKMQKEEEKEEGAQGKAGGRTTSCMHADRDCWGPSMQLHKALEITMISACILTRSEIYLNVTSFAK